MAKKPLPNYIRVNGRVYKRAADEPKKPVADPGLSAEKAGISAKLQSLLPSVQKAVSSDELEKVLKDFFQDIQALRTAAATARIARTKQRATK